MNNEQTSDRGAMIEAFNRHGKRTDGEHVVAGLDSGLTLLCDLFYTRIHRDVERYLGADSMIMPLSETNAETDTKRVIEVYQVAESACAVREYGYLQSDWKWYADWLAGLRLGSGARDGQPPRQIAEYMELVPRARRLALTDVLLKVLPESRKAPMVLYRLVPSAVRIATALAFGEGAAAAELRKRQKTLLPSIADCPACRGAVLESGKSCEVCENPMWSYEYLTATD
jgi:hypothetical protein